MDDHTLKEIAALVNELRAEVRGLSDRLAMLEQRPDGGSTGSALNVGAKPASAPAPAPAPAPATTAVVADTTEEDLLVISAAVAAYLGVRARIRHIRLIQSSSWVQVGRATVHASHRVH